MLLMENSLIISCKKVVNITEGWMIKGEILLDTVKLFFRMWLKGLEQLVEIRHGWIYKYFTVSSHLNFMAQDFIERKTITTFWNINFASFAPCMKYASPLLNYHDKRVLRGGRSSKSKISKLLCIASDMAGLHRALQSLIIDLHSHILIQIAFFPSLAPTLKASLKSKVLHLSKFY